MNALLDTSQPWLSVCLSLCIFATNTSAQDSNPVQKPQNSISKPVAHPWQVELIVPAHDGIVLWSDIASSIANSLKLDQESVQKLLPRGKIDLRSETVLLLLMGINLAAGESIHVGLVHDANNQPALCVKCDGRMFGATTRIQESKTAGIEIDQDWKRRSETLPLVLCLHGLQSQPSVFDDLREHLRSHGYATAAVSYDYNQSIPDSAKQISLIAEELLAETTTPVAVIGHSMGGLVAREWAENKTLRSHRIVSLITVGTPHSGSNWASLPPLLDLFTAGDFDAQDLMDVILHQPSSPGLRDLVPQSEFLQRLNARPRRENLAYTNIIGTGSPIDDQTVLGIRDTLRRLDQDGSLVRLIRPRIAPLLDSFDELARGRGDGVVSVKHATIDGVKNTIQVDISHFEMIREMEGSHDQPVWNTIVESLSQAKAK